MLVSHRSVHQNVFRFVISPDYGRFFKYYRVLVSTPLLHPTRDAVEISLVPPPGIEPGSSVLQTGAMTTFAKAACIWCFTLVSIQVPTPYQDVALPIELVKHKLHSAKGSVYCLS